MVLLDYNGDAVVEGDPYIGIGTLEFAEADTAQLIMGGRGYRVDAGQMLPTTDLLTDDEVTAIVNAILTSDPEIHSFANAMHTHQDDAGGGLLDVDAIGSGTFIPERLGTGSNGFLFWDGITTQAFRSIADGDIPSGIARDSEVSSAVAAHAALTTTHGVSGLLVGTTDAQTLSNKTLVTPAITDSAWSHGTGAGFFFDERDSGGTRYWGLYGNAHQLLFWSSVAGSAKIAFNDDGSAFFLGDIATSGLVDGVDIFGLYTDYTAHAAATAAHGATGAVVGTTNTQTLTNKTLTTPTIASFMNATHSHLNAAGGGLLDAAAINTGVLGYARVGNGSNLSGRFLGFANDGDTTATYRALLPADIPALTSAQLAGILSDETGYNTGAVAVFSHSPTFYSSSGAAASYFATNSSATGFGSSQANQSMRNDDSTTGNWTLIGFYDAAGSIVGGYGAQVTDQTNAYGEIAFYTRSASGFAERLRITGAGLVLSGTVDGIDISDFHDAYAIHTHALTDLTGTLAIGHGGTGQVTAATAFDALSPVTTRGDLIFRNATTNARLAKGTTGQVLAQGVNDPFWVSLSSTYLSDWIHTHHDDAGGGLLDTGAISSGVFAAARLGSGSANSASFLRGDGTWTDNLTGRIAVNNFVAHQSSDGLSSLIIAYAHGQSNWVSLWQDDDSSNLFGIYTQFAKSFVPFTAVSTFTASSTVTLGGLTASRPLELDGSKNVTSPAQLSYWGLGTNDNSVDRILLLSAGGTNATWTTPTGTGAPARGTNPAFLQGRWNAGSDSAGSGTYAYQISLGYQGTDTYRHWIRTRHSGGAANNFIDFYTCDGTSAGTFPTNAVLGLSINNGKILSPALNLSGATASRAAIFNSSKDMVSTPAAQLAYNLIGVGSNTVRNFLGIQFTAETEGTWMSILGSDIASPLWPTLALIDAKGDLYVGTADNTVSRLARGTNGQILAALSTETTGLKWVDFPLRSAQGIHAISVTVDFGILGTTANQNVTAAWVDSSTRFSHVVIGGSALVLDQIAITINPGTGAFDLYASSATAITGTVVIHVITVQAD